MESCISERSGVCEQSGFSTAFAHDPDALWKIVNGQCVPDQIKNGNPSPCTRVDIVDGVDRGAAVLKDINGNTHFLVIPTAKITGIESPALLAPDARNYFEDAWQARNNIEKMKAGASRDTIGLAINSRMSRSQQQLHIHIDFLLPQVRDSLRQHLSEIGNSWKPFPVPLNGHEYMAMKVAGEELQQNPFKLLADGIPGARDDMGAQTLVVAGETFADGKPGFVVLADHFDSSKNDRAHGEDLLDHQRYFDGTGIKVPPEKFQLPRLDIEDSSSKNRKFPLK
jgi:CDP-diacylglycerol pyrophosphatase